MENNDIAEALRHNLDDKDAFEPIIPTLPFDASFELTFSKRQQYVAIPLHIFLLGCDVGDSKQLKRFCEFLGEGVFSAVFHLEFGQETHRVVDKIRALAFAPGCSVALYFVSQEHSLASLNMAFMREVSKHVRIIPVLVAKEGGEASVQRKRLFDSQCGSLLRRNSVVFAVRQDICLDCGDNNGGHEATRSLASLDDLSVIAHQLHFMFELSTEVKKQRPRDKHGAFKFSFNLVLLSSFLILLVTMLVLLSAHVLSSVSHNEQLGKDTFTPPLMSGKPRLSTVERASVLNAPPNKYVMVENSKFEIKLCIIITMTESRVCKQYEQVQEYGMDGDGDVYSYGEVYIAISELLSKVVQECQALLNCLKQENNE
jgi:hypothetical protein